VAAIGALTALAAAGCSSSSGTGGTNTNTPAAGAKVLGGTATYWVLNGNQPNWIFPFYPITNSSVYNSQQFQYLMYRPLYYFGGEDNKTVTVNYALSPANAPTYSGSTITIDMKGWKWSNGETVDASSVIFFLNMMKAEKANFYGYVPGLAPDNMVSYSATGPNTLTITTDKPYSSVWYTYNQLAQVTPMPKAWDVTSLGAAPGSGGCITDTAADKWAKCVAVWSFLTAQSKSASTYASSPLWSVVNGPWKLSAFSVDGNDTFVPNPAYSGSPKPTLSAFKYAPYTDSAAIYTALKTGSVDVAQIPSGDLPLKPNAAQVLPSTNPLGAGYNLQAFYPFGINFAIPNFNGPNHALWHQLYIRQALQELENQPGMDLAIFHGYGYPTSGPVPTQPVTQWVPPSQTVNSGQGPYVFSIANAKALLTSHGWSVVNGVMTCQDAAKCGAGITQGQQLKIQVDYSTGSAVAAQEAATYKSDASQAGVDLNIVGKTFNAIIAETAACKIGPKCNWDLSWFGGWAFNGPGFEPTGEPLFATGAGSNTGSYSDPAEDRLIQQTELSSDMSAFNQYAAYTSQQLPYIWTSNNYRVIAVHSKLQGVAFNPMFDLLPEYWYFTK
jgi:peptide/nickel transport system substrate-binding protein